LVTLTGAGYQSDENRNLYEKLCKKASEAGYLKLDETGSALDAVCSAIAVLEDSELTNAGLGSNLCMNGTVECDAGIMSSCNCDWAAVGALKGIKNPIVVARDILLQQSSKIPCGLVPPSLLVGDGARDWAIENNSSTSAELSTGLFR